MRILCFILFLGAAACGETTSVGRYFSPQQADTLLVNIITYLYVPEGVSTAARFQPQFRNRYFQSKSTFSFIRLLKISDGYYYYLLLRAEPDGQRRSMGGRFRAEGTRIADLEEIFVGPALDRQTALERGEYLFKEVVENRGLPSNLAEMKHYVEWPNDMQYYDTLSHTWVFVDSLIHQ